MSEAICEDILKNYQIFDIRTKDEWQESGIIKDAVLLSFTLDDGSLNPEFISEFQRLADKNKDIAFVCATGQRSSAATHLIKKQLGLDTTNLKGGMFALALQGYQTTPYEDKQ